MKRICIVCNLFLLLSCTTENTDSSQETYRSDLDALNSVSTSRDLPKQTEGLASQYDINFVKAVKADSVAGSLLLSLVTQNTKNAEVAAIAKEMMQDQVNTLSQLNKIYSFKDSTISGSDSTIINDINKLGSLKTMNSMKGL